MEQNKEPPSEEGSPTIEKEKVLLNRTWAFWENYQSKDNAEKDYSKLLKEIYTFNDIISFWQFWNHYPGNDIKKIFFDGEYLHYFFKEKYRIIAINVFQKDIRPEWEDKKNSKGNILTLSYTTKKNEDIDDFLTQVSKNWIKLICLLIGEALPNCENINGIRFVDKTKFNKSIIFKYEIWVNSIMKEKELDKLKEYCNQEFECQGTIKPIN
jgi:hypothetical protein